MSATCGNIGTDGYESVLIFAARACVTRCRGISCARDSHFQKVGKVCHPDCQRAHTAEFDAEPSLLEQVAQFQRRFLAMSAGIDRASVDHDGQGFAVAIAATTEGLGRPISV